MFRKAVLDDYRRQILPVHEKSILVSLGTLSFAQGDGLREDVGLKAQRFLLKPGAGQKKREFVTRIKTSLPGFEPGSQAPQACVLSKLYYRDLQSFEFQA